ncbi:GTP cyclohydrolase I FolE [Pelobium manganitolerans]|uniref:GTP cyclohydrolase 1 n=1 Tax=Pelobium manganitolerans TaxID=1842495 RepID=A0A419S2I7_9SPHI|nr:GTP cyclohydrolase I FolE [Pelobium manganitolerans]RKD13205.1 GTP cyclohydrolase I FolE [Pelobium manganitolerans]
MKIYAEKIDKCGEDHFSANIDTPLRPGAFLMDDEEKIEAIAKNFKNIMEILGLDLTDDSLKNTPHRVAKMYVKEVFKGLNPANKPSISMFNNNYQYRQMLVEKNITLYSYCEHHFVPIIGKVHVAYISSGEVIGLSKINRLVQYYANRPQVQERLTQQIANGLKEALNTPHVAVMVDAEHLCVASRGIKDTASSTVTFHFSGDFQEKDVRAEFLATVNAK